MKIVDGAPKYSTARPALSAHVSRSPEFPTRFHSASAMYPSPPPPWFSSPLVRIPPRERMTWYHVAREDRIIDVTNAARARQLLADALRPIKPLRQQVFQFSSHGTGKPPLSSERLRAVRTRGGQGRVSGRPCHANPGAVPTQVNGCSDIVCN